LGKNTGNIKNNETLLDVGKKARLFKNAEETEYILMSRHQEVGEDHDRYTGANQL
jgi:hypothetical protein